MRTLVAALTLGLVCASVPARAEPQPGDQELARAHFITGRSYYDQGRWADALKEFQEAYRLSQRPGFLYNVGVCYEQLHQPAQAIDAFERYLGASPKAPDRAEVQTRIDRLRAAEAAAPRPKPAPAVAVAPAAVAATPAPARPSDRPVYKRAWFWGVIGGAALLVAGGITAGVVVASRNRGPRTLMDVYAQ